MKASVLQNVGEMMGNKLLTQVELNERLQRDAAIVGARAELESAYREVSTITYNAIARLSSFADGLEDTAPAAAARLRHTLAGSPFGLERQYRAAFDRVERAYKALTQEIDPQ